MLTQMFTEKQLVPGGEKWIVVAFLSVGKMALIPFLTQWKYNNLVCKLSCKVFPAPWEILVILHICNELKHRSRCYCMPRCNQDVFDAFFRVFCLFWFRLSKSALLQKGAVTYRSLSGPQPGWWNVCKGKFLWGWEEGKWKHFMSEKLQKK